MLTVGVTIVHATHEKDVHLDFEIDTTLDGIQSAVAQSIGADPGIRTDRLRDSRLDTIKGCVYLEVEVNVLFVSRMDDCDADCQH